MAFTDISIGHMEHIESPWANAGGVAKTVEDVEALARTGVGWIEDGSHPREPRLGNKYDPEHPELGPYRNVYTHNPETGETGNSLGMPTKGMDVVELEVPEKVRIAESHGKKYVLNIAPVSDDPESETLDLVRRGYEAGAHAVLVNGGCPNIVSPDGGRHELLSRNPEALYKTLVGLRVVTEQFYPVFLRISPQEDYERAAKVFRAIVQSGTVSAVFTPNTWPGYVPTDKDGNPLLDVPGGIGGLSGPKTAARSAEQTFWATELLAGTGIDTVSSSGIMNAAELEFRLNIGAVAGCGTTFFYEPVNGWQDDTNRLLSDLAVQS